jgi:hypothetical protein
MCDRATFAVSLLLLRERTSSRGRLAANTWHCNGPIRHTQFVLPCPRDRSICRRLFGEARSVRAALELLDESLHGRGSFIPAERGGHFDLPHVRRQRLVNHTWNLDA